MRFRPCIDIHNGTVKQIVGSSLNGSEAIENFVADRDAGWYASLYREDDLRGGHIILLNPAGTEEYEKDLEQAKQAMKVWPGGFQIGGGVRAETAARFLDLGASHVIVTSYAFAGGEILYDNIERLRSEVGKEQIVLDISCVAAEDGYRIVTDRWKTQTQVMVNEASLRELASFCDEFLIHAVAVEGTCSGIETELASLLGNHPFCPMTYAGGVACVDDLYRLAEVGQGHLDVTVGSALDLFGGKLPYRDVVDAVRMISR